MAVLLAHLLKWQYQPERQSVSWQRTIKEQRKAIGSHLRQVPSLKPKLENDDWKILVWADAVSIAIAETGMGSFPETCPWDVDSILSESWLPG
jgi:hypothetical protein